MVQLVELPEKFTCCLVYIWLSLSCTSVFPATNLVQGYVILWIPNLLYFPLQSRQHIIWSNVGNGMVLDTFTIMRELVSFHY